IEAQGLIRDRDGCFNINALSQFQWPGMNGFLLRSGQESSADNGTDQGGNNAQQQPGGRNNAQLSTAILVFYRLLINNGVDRDQARNLTLVILNWFGTTLPPGLQAQRQNNPAASAGLPKRVMVDISQLREIKGIDQKLYLTLASQVCVHRDNKLAVNINTLSVQQAPLLAALLPNQISLAQAQAILQQRPTEGWANIDDLFKQNNLPLNPQGGVRVLTTESNYFELLIWLRASGQVYPLRTLLLRKQGRLYVLQRRYGWGE
ncbi:MAG: type II secretion system minor pseudopilin GspK, partial [Enterobacteriaceae bacterium]